MTSSTRFVFGLVLWKSKLLCCKKLQGYKRRAEYGYVGTILLKTSTHLNGDLAFIDILRREIPTQVPIKAENSNLFQASGESVKEVVES